MADEVYMDIPAVHQMAKNFGNIGDVLATVNQTLEILVNTLKATAFIGLVGGGAVIAFIEMIKPHIKNMSDKCKELNRDLESSVRAYERGDAQGATRFY
jgi:hypothetical protein